MSTDCFLCLASSPTPLYFKTIINEALYDRYATSYNDRYLDSIDDLVEVEYTEQAARFREYSYLDDDEDHLSRMYRLEEWNKKISKLGSYWSYHIDVPRFFGLPVEQSFYKYYDRIRQYQEKQYRIKMGEYEDSYSSFQDESEISRNPNKDDMQNILRDLSQRGHLDESNAFHDICGKLHQLVKTKGKRIKKITVLPYWRKEDPDRDNFSVFLKDQSKPGRKKRAPRRNLVSDEALPVYAFRKPNTKIRNISKELLHKGSMESTMSKKNICNINIQIQNAVFCAENKGQQPFKPLLKDVRSINSIRFKNFANFDKKPSVGQIYGTITQRPKPGILNNNSISKPALVDFKKRSNNRSQSVLKQPSQRTSIMTLKARSNSINTIRYIPPNQRKATPEVKKPSPSKSKKDFSVTLNNGLFKRRPSPSTSRGKIATQSSVKRFTQLQSTEEARIKVDKLLNQKLFLNANPNSLYEKLKRNPK